MGGSGRHWMDLLNALAGVGVREPGARVTRPGARGAAAIAGALGGTVRESAMPGVVDPRRTGPAAGPAYDGDMMIAVERYAPGRRHVCRKRLRRHPRARLDDLPRRGSLALAGGRQAAGRPRALHRVRPGGRERQPAGYDIERRGHARSTRVIAVSELDALDLPAEVGGVEGWKVEVVYNGIDTEQHQPTSEDTIQPQDKIVLFLSASRCRRAGVLHPGGPAASWSESRT